LNATNEIAVGAFLERRIGFSEIAAMNAAILDLHLKDHRGEKVDEIDAVLAADSWARGAATEWLAKQPDDLDTAAARGAV
jgi:1-deoxy-D-xylulose-5-phosphate reductoisomerase